MNSELELYIDEFEKALRTFGIREDCVQAVRNEHTTPENLIAVALDTLNLDKETFDNLKVLLVEGFCIARTRERLELD